MKRYIDRNLALLLLAIPIAFGGLIGVLTLLMAGPTDLFRLMTDLERVQGGETDVTRNVLTTSLGLLVYTFNVYVSILLVMKWRNWVFAAPCLAASTVALVLFLYVGWVLPRSTGVLPDIVYAELSFIAYALATGVLCLLAMTDIDSRKILHGTVVIILATASVFSLLVYEDGATASAGRMEVLGRVFSVLFVLSVVSAITVALMHFFRRPGQRSPFQVVNSRISFYCPNCEEVCTIERGVSKCPSCSINLSFDLFY
jgi:hypothetical protein